jgi:hypothetical protein
MEVVLERLLRDERLEHRILVIRHDEQRVVGTPVPDEERPRDAGTPTKRLSTRRGAIVWPFVFL